MSSCHKDDNSVAPIDKLPLATQTGAGTFACLVNGEPFIDNSRSFNCFYQLVGGEYYFGIRGRNESFELFGIHMGTYNKEIVEGETYSLLEVIDGNAWGSGSFKSGSTNSISSNTNQEFTGELKITKFDFATYIVSGTFWFDLKNPISGETVKIREGRFDSHFTQ